MMKKLKAVSPVDQQVRSLQTDLSQLDADIKSKITQLPDHCRNASLVELNRYSHAVRERLTQFDNKMAEFEQLISQTKSKKSGLDDQEDSAAVAILDRFRNESHNNLQNLRRITLSVMQSIEKREREQLFRKQGPESDSNLRQRQVQGANNHGAGLAGQSSELTEGLTALVRQMDSQVRQSEATLTALIGSSQSLGETETEFKDMGATIKSSGKLLSKYGRREITDKLLIFLALLLFFGTCFYIVKKRTLGHFW